MSPAQGQNLSVAASGNLPGTWPRGLGRLRAPSSPGPSASTSGHNCSLFKAPLLPYQEILNEGCPSLPESTLAEKEGGEQENRPRDSAGAPPAQGVGATHTLTNADMHRGAHRHSSHTHSHTCAHTHTHPITASHNTHSHLCIHTLTDNTHKHIGIVTAHTHAHIHVHICTHRHMHTQASCPLRVHTQEGLACVSHVPNAHAGTDSPTCTLLCPPNGLHIA